MPVTTRNVIFFRIGDPYKPSFATVAGRGDNKRYWVNFKAYRRSQKTAENTNRKKPASRQILGHGIPISEFLDPIYYTYVF